MQHNLQKQWNLARTCGIRQGEGLNDTSCRTQSSSWAEPTRRTEAKKAVPRLDHTVEKALYRSCI